MSGLDELKFRLQLLRALRDKLIKNGKIHPINFIPTLPELPSKLKTLLPLVIVQNFYQRVTIN